MYSLDPKQTKQLSMFIKFSLRRRPFTDSAKGPIQSVPSTRRKVLVTPDINEEKIFTKERRKGYSEHP